MNVHIEEKENELSFDIDNHTSVDDFVEDFLPILCKKFDLKFNLLQYFFYEKLIISDE